MRYNKPALSKPIPVKLKPETLGRIDTICQKLGEGRSMVMRLALAVGLEGLEKILSAPSADLSKIIYSLQSDESGGSEPKKTNSSRGTADKKDVARAGAQAVPDAPAKKQKAP